MFLNYRSYCYFLIIPYNSTSEGSLTSSENFSSLSSSSERNIMVALLALKAQWNALKSLSEHLLYLLSELDIQTIIGVLSHVS